MATPITKEVTRYEDEGPPQALSLSPPQSLLPSMDEVRVMEYLSQRTIDNFIVRLRRLLEPDPQAPRYIHTVRGTGYRLTP